MMLDARQMPDDRLKNYVQQIKTAPAWPTESAVDPLGVCIRRHHTIAIEIVIEKCVKAKTLPTSPLAFAPASTFVGLGFRLPEL